ncbi:hypothetical protein ABZV67_09115 [Streptomyces sp. NPDC005065]|uniref:hypothetical protein n=1 Tax=Streptomyces sp. NPDC005065 TaxID=3154461 RepID=UPI0033A5B99D
MTIGHGGGVFGGGICKNASGPNTSVLSKPVTAARRQSVICATTSNGTTTSI